MLGLGLGLPPMQMFSAGGGGGGGPSFDQVMLLMGFEGADGSTSFTDESSFARTITPEEQAQIDTAQFKFGASSMLVDGSFDHVSAPDSADFDFGTGAFSIEAWIRPATVTGAFRPIFFYGTTSPDFVIQIFSDGRLSASFFDTGATETTLTQPGATMTAGNWYHIVFDRDDAGDGRLYIDGAVVVGPTAMTGAQRRLGGTMRIGRNQQSADGFSGHIDEARIIKGATPYGGAFTPPAAAFPRP